MCKDKSNNKCEINVLLLFIIIQIMMKYDKFLQVCKVLQWWRNQFNVQTIDDGNTVTTALKHELNWNYDHIPEMWKHPAIMTTSQNN